MEHLELLIAIERLGLKSAGRCPGSGCKNNHCTEQGDIRSDTLIGITSQYDQSVLFLFIGDIILKLNYYNN